MLTEGQEAFLDLARRWGGHLSYLQESRYLEVTQRHEHTLGDVSDWERALEQAVKRDDIKDPVRLLLDRAMAYRNPRYCLPWFDPEEKVGPAPKVVYRDQLSPQENAVYAKKLAEKLRAFKEKSSGALRDPDGWWRRRVDSAKRRLRMAEALARRCESAPGRAGDPRGPTNGTGIPS